MLFWNKQRYKMLTLNLHNMIVILSLQTLHVEFNEQIDI